MNTKTTERIKELFSDFRRGISIGGLEGLERDILSLVGDSERPPFTIIRGMRVVSSTENYLGAMLATDYSHSPEFCLSIPLKVESEEIRSDYVDFAEKIVENLKTIRKGLFIIDGKITWNHHEKKYHFAETAHTCNRYEAFWDNKNKLFTPVIKETTAPKKKISEDEIKQLVAEYKSEFLRCNGYGITSVFYFQGMERFQIYDESSGKTPSLSSINKIRERIDSFKGQPDFNLTTN